MGEEYDNDDLDTVTLHQFDAPIDGNEILVVSPGEQESFFKEQFSAIIAHDIREAKKLAFLNAPAVILCCEPTAESFGFLEGTAAKVRAVFCEYDELPELAKARPAGIKIISRNVAPHRLERLLGSRNRRATPSGLLERTLSHFGESMRVFVRQPSPKGVELVLVPRSDTNLTFSEPGWSETTEDIFGLGKLDASDKIYQGTWNGTPVWLAWIHWRKQNRVTVIVKTTPAGVPMPVDEAATVHSIATQSIRHIVMPQVPDQMTYSPEYEWVLGPSYVGPDRRKEDTPFLSLATLKGNRKSIPKHWPGALGFIDGLTRESKRYLFLYVLCSTIDLVLTLIFIGGGVFSEANGALRWAVHKPILFCLVKTSLAVTGFLLMSRFQLWKSSLLSRFAIGIYLVLLSYWAFLLFKFLTG